MALKLADRVRETTTSTGTGAITLGGAVAGFVSFSSVLSTNDTTYYVIVSSTATDWEVGIGTYSSNTLTRTTVLDSSNSNALVNFSVGTKAVFIAQPAGRAVYSDGTSIVSSDGKSVLTTAGGTGVTSYSVGDTLYYAAGTVLSKLSIGTAGQVITSTGTAPQWSTLSGIAVTTISFGSTGLTPNSATGGAVTVAGTLGTANGGTNLTSFTSGGAVYASSTSALTTGTLPIASGGTSQTTASAAFNALSPITTAGDLILGNGTNSATRLAIGTNAYVLTSNGTTASWAAPTGVSSISFGSTGLTPNTATTGVVSVAGTLSPANGGTGLTSGTSGGVPYFSSTSAIASSALLTANALMIGGGAGTAPSTTTTGTGVVTALGVNTGTAGAFLVNGGVLGTPSSGTLTNCTFPTLNQNTSGTAGGLSGTPNITTGTILAGNTQINSLGINTAASGTAGEIRATNNITAYYSDDRLKTKLGNIQDALAKVKTLSGFYYEANQTAQDLGYEAVREVGVSAQQVQAVLPEIVVPAPIDEKYWTVRYEKLIPLLIEAIKELDAKVESLVKE